MVIYASHLKYRNSSIFNFFKSSNFGQEDGNLQKFEYSRTKKNDLAEIKGIFHNFFRTFF